jgi:Phage portal protein
VPLDDPLFRTHRLDAPAHRAPTWWQRLWAGRRRHEPQRMTEQYARMKQIGSWNLGKNKPIIKPTPANLRYFSRTVYASRAINLYSKPISMLDWHVAPREGVKENSEIRRQIEVVTTCLQSPNNDDSLTTMMQQLVEDTCVAGAGALEIGEGGDRERPIWLWPTDALSIQVYANWDGEKDRPRYQQSLGYGNVGVAHGIDLLNSELIYMRDRPTTDTPFSFGMLEVAFSTINRILGVTEYAGAVASNAHPANILFLQNAGQQELEALRTYWRNEIEGRGQLPIVGQGSGEAKVLPIRPVDDSATFPKYTQLVIRELATAFGCSPQNFGVEADVNRSTAEVAEDRDWDISLKPMALMIAAHLNREMIWGTLGYSQIELVPGGLDREDEMATADIYAKEYTGNAITPNEYRARRNMPPLKSQFGDLVKADADIAIAAARGAKAVDPEITSKE